MTLMDVQEVAWDLDPLVDGEGPEGADRLLDEADERAARFAETLRGPRRRARRRRARRRDGRARGDRRPRSAAPATTRCCASPSTPPTRPTARCSRACRSGHGDRDEAALLRARVGRARRRARRRAARPPTGLDDDAPPPAHAAPLPPAPPLRARGEAHDREGAHRPRRVDAPVLRADERDPRRAARRRRAASPLDVALSRLVSPDRELRRTTAEAVTAALEPGLRTRAYVFNTLLHDKAVDDRLRSLPELAGEPQPRQRGQRRVGAGAARGRALQLRPAAALVPPQGRAARRRPARRLRPHGLGRRRGGDGRVARGQRPRAHAPSTSSRPCSATSRSASSTSAGSTRRCARTSAAARSAPTPTPSVHPYVMLNYTRRRRDVLDARPRARPRPARGARHAARAASSSTRR